MQMATHGLGRVGTNTDAWRSLAAAVAGALEPASTGIAGGPGCPATSASEKHSPAPGRAFDPIRFDVGRRRMVSLVCVSSTSIDYSSPLQAGRQRVWTHTAPAALVAVVVGKSPRSKQRGHSATSGRTQRGAAGQRTGQGRSRSRSSGKVQAAAGETMGCISTKVSRRVWIGLLAPARKRASRQLCSSARIGARSALLSNPAGRSPVSRTPAHPLKTQNTRAQLPPEQDPRLRGATPSGSTFDKDYILGRQVRVDNENTPGRGGWGWRRGSAD